MKKNAIFWLKYLSLRLSIILFIAFVIQTINIQVEIYEDPYMVFNFLFGFSIIPSVGLAVLSFSVGKNYISKVCSIGNIVLCITNYFHVINYNNGNVEVYTQMVNSSLIIESVVIVLIALFSSIKNSYAKRSDNTNNIKY